MSTPRFPKFLLAVSAVLSIGLLFWQYQDREQLRSEVVRLRVNSAEFDQIKTENLRLSKLTNNTAELESLRQNQPELMRLRDEVGRLRNELARKTQSAASAPHVQEQAIAKPAETVEEFTDDVSVTLQRGQTTLTGGWVTKTGFRTMVLAKSEGADNGQIDIEAKFVEASDETWRKLGMESLFAGGSTTNRAILTEQQAPGIIKALQQLGASVLGNPRFSTSSGVTTSIASAELPDANGQKVPFGPTLSVTPEMTDNGAIRLQLKTQINVVRKAE